MGAAPPVPFAPPDPPPAAASEVVVRAARLPDPAGDAAFSIVTVSPERLAQATTLDGALKSVPGFSLYRRTSTLGANPTTQGVALRAIAGSGASRALVTLDGVPQNDPFGGWVIWSALPSVAVGGAQVVRGAGAGPYGAGALTGVVRLDSPRDDGLSGEASGGNLGYREGQAALGVSRGATRVALDAAGTDSGGWIPVRAGRGAADRPLDLHAWSAAGRVEQDVGPATLAMRLAGYEEDRGAGVVNASSRASGVQGSLTLARTPTASAWGWRLQGWASGSDLYNASATVANARNSSVPANVQYATPALGAGLNAALRRTAGASSLEFGVDVRAATGESRERFGYSAAAAGFLSTRKSGGETLVAGVYAEASRRAGPWLLTGGVRADRWSQDAAERVEAVRATGAVTLDARPPGRSGALPTGRLGLRRDLGGGLAWRTAAYAGFRPATLNELHRPFRVGNTLTEADPALDPERLYGAETGLDLARGRATLSATVFRNRLEDAITNVTLGRGPGAFSVPGLAGVRDVIAAGGFLRMRANAGAVDATGLEAEATDSFWADRLRLRAAVAYTYSVVDAGAAAPQLDGLRPALTPRAAVTAEARWRPIARAELTLDARYESRRFDDDLNTLPLRASLGIDAQAIYALTPAWSVFAAADNLFDAAIRTAETADGVYSYDAPRLVRVGVRLRR